MQGPREGVSFFFLSDWRHTNQVNKRTGGREASSEKCHGRDRFCDGSRKGNDAFQKRGESLTARHLGTLSSTRHVHGTSSSRLGLAYMVSLGSCGVNVLRVVLCRLVARSDDFSAVRTRLTKGVVENEGCRTQHNPSAEHEARGKSGMTEKRSYRPTQSGRTVMSYVFSSPSRTRLPKADTSADGTV